MFLDFLGLSIVSTREVFKPRVSTLYVTRLLPHNLTLFVLSRLSCGNRARVSPAGSPEIPTGTMGDMRLYFPGGDISIIIRECPRLDVLSIRFDHCRHRLEGGVSFPGNRVTLITGSAPPRIDAPRAVGYHPAQWLDLPPTLELLHITA